MNRLETAKRYSQFTVACCKKKTESQLKAGVDQDRMLINMTLWSSAGDVDVDVVMVELYPFPSP